MNTGWFATCARILLALSLLSLHPLPGFFSLSSPDHALRDAIVAQQGLSAGEGAGLDSALRAIVTSMRAAAGFNRIVIPMNGEGANRDAAIVLQVDHPLLPSAFSFTVPAVAGSLLFFPCPMSLCGSSAEPECPPPRCFAAV